MTTTDPDEWEALLHQVDAEVGDDPTADEWANIPESIDDSHMAAAFARHIANRYLYVATSHRWYRWDGRRWAHDVTESVHEEARRFVIDLAEQMFQHESDRARLRRIIDYRSKGRLDAVVTLARRIDGIAARADEFDTDHDVLNVGNGIVNLRTGILSPHDPARRMTKLADADYLPDAVHPDIESVLAVVDDEVRDWLQVLVGYAATGNTSEDVVAVLDGAGSNGKTTLLEAVSAALGDYAEPAAPRLIMRSANEEHPAIKADLQGRRLVHISETEEGGSLRMEALKALSGGDQIKARVMHGDWFSFTPTHTLVVATNHRPFVNATDYAAWRRLRLVPFPHTYRPAAEIQPGDRPKDDHLRQRIKGTDQREAMLSWVVAGSVRWYRSGLPRCSTVDDATASWRSSEDVILRFIGDELTFDPDGEIRGRDLYALYQDWCRGEGRQHRSNKNFATEFMAHETVVAAGVTKVNPQRVATYRGVRRAR